MYVGVFEGRKYGEGSLDIHQWELVIVSQILLGRLSCTAQ